MRVMAGIHRIPVDGVRADHLQQQRHFKEHQCAHLPSRGGDREVLASPLQPVRVCKPVLHSSTFL